MRYSTCDGQRAILGPSVPPRPRTHPPGPFPVTTEQQIRYLRLVQALLGVIAGLVTLGLVIRGAA